MAELKHVGFCTADQIILLYISGLVDPLSEEQQKVGWPTGVGVVGLTEIFLWTDPIIDQ